MLPADQSPIRKLVSIWKTSRPPTCGEISACRARLFTAATHEILENSNIGHLYDPLCDFRFKWAAQWLSVADGTTHAIDPDLELLMDMALNAAPKSHKQLAANDS